MFVIIICIFTDIGGYIFGKVFKGPKLTKISPNKTYSGVIGSFLISLSVFADKYFPDGEWETAKPDQVGLDQEKIDKLFEKTFLKLIRNLNSIHIETFTLRLAT